MMNNDQYLELFLSEAEEILTALNQHLLELEKKPTDSTLLEMVFRSCHTLKGNAAAMGYDQIMKTAHTMENTLSQLKKGEINLNKAVMDSLLEGLDLLDDFVSRLKHQGKMNIDDVSLNNKLNATDEPKKSIHEHSDMVLKNIKSVRVNLNQIDDLINTVGELHINRTRLLELAQTQQDEHLIKAIHDLERIVNRLQGEAMQIRLLPIKYLFNYFPRLVRNDAELEGKEIELIMTGSDIGVDRTILDEINDPLIHLIRNAISHGIESPDERIKQGKPAQGQIKVTAIKEKNKVALTISDDGQGINPEEVKAQILKQGLLSAEEVNKLSPDEILMLITLPGFSLSKQVNERSGRGIGMNIVKTKLEGIGGSFSIHSELNKGTTFTLRLPISMAIIPAMLVKLEEEVCAIPLFNIIEMVKLNSSLIRRIENQEMIPYREEALPLIRTKEKLGFEMGKQSIETPMLFIVVCEINQNKIGLIVDYFIGQQQIVIKNLSNLAQGTRGFSGATILGNGKVALIIDVASLAQ